MNNQNFLISIIVTIALELIVEGLLKKSTPFVLSPYFNLVKETLYLFKIIRKPRFKKWDKKNKRYVDLKGSELNTSMIRKSEEFFSLLTNFISLEISEPIFIVGDPGSGKTTILEALTQRLAKATYQRQKILLGILFIGFPLVFINPIILIIFLLVYSLILRFILRIIAQLRAVKIYISKRLPITLPPLSLIPLIPIFIDARSDFTGGKVRDWASMTATLQLSKETIQLDKFDGIIWIIDGVNEISEDLYPLFIEGWRAILSNKPSFPVVFSSRKDQNPSRRLGLRKSIEILPLDEFSVKSFIEIHNRELVQGEQKAPTYDDLKRNELLGTNGIARNPYWLQMLLSSGFLTSNKGRLFQRSIEGLITREIEQKPEERKRKSSWKNIVPLEIELYALSCLAYAMFEKKKVGFATPEGWIKARKIIKNTLDESTYLIDDILDQAEAAMLIVQEYRKRIEFVHQLVQDFFVAKYLNNEIRTSIFKNPSVLPVIQISSILDDFRDQRDFAEIFLMLMGNSDYQTDLINWLIVQIIEKRHKPSIFLLRSSIEMINETSKKDVSSFVVNLLLRSSHDPDIHIRWDTVVVLGELKNPDILEPLIVDLLEPDTFAYEKLKNFIKDNDAYSFNEIISSLQNQNSLVRRYAIKMLENIDESKVIEPLILALKDNDPNVRWQAVYALGKVGDSRAISELERLVNTDSGVANSKLKISNSAQEAILNIKLRQGAKV